MLLRFTRAGGRPVYLESDRISTVSHAYRAGDDIEATYDGATVITCGNESIIVLGRVEDVAQFIHDTFTDIPLDPPTFNPDARVSE